MEKIPNSTEKQDTWLESSLGIVDLTDEDLKCFVDEIVGILDLGDPDQCAKVVCCYKSNKVEFSNLVNQVIMSIPLILALSPSENFESYMEKLSGPLKKIPKEMIELRNIILLWSGVHPNCSIRSEMKLPGIQDSLIENRIQSWKEIMNKNGVY